MYKDKEFFSELDRLLVFQLDDLGKCLSAEADILCLIGCFNLIEFLGGIRNGKLGKDRGVKSRFTEGIKLIGNKWADRNVIGEVAMWHLRNALVHQYIPRAPDFGIIVIMGSKIKWAIDTEALRPESKVRGRISKLLPFPIVELLNDISQARFKLLNELKKDNEMRVRANERLFELPKLKEKLG